VVTKRNETKPAHLQDSTAEKEAAHIQTGHKARREKKGPDGNPIDGPGEGGKPAELEPQG
jgi:hypothetical protein